MNLRIAPTETSFCKLSNEGGRLIADVLQTTDMLKLNGMLVTIDIQKPLIQLIINS